MIIEDVFFSVCYVPVVIVMEYGYT